MSELLKILACQIDVPPVRTSAERDAHVSGLCECVSAELEKEAVDLVLLPELSTLDYSRDAFSQLMELSETLDGPSVRQWSKVCKKYNTHLAFGMARLNDKGSHCVTSVVLASDGSVLGCYDKIHLAQFGASMEKEYFVAGEGLFVFTLNGFRFGTLICADIRFPEASRSLVVDHDIDVLLHPSAYSRDSTFFSWHSFVQTRAIENQIYVVSLNRAGVDYGKSILVPPWVDDNHKPTVFHESIEEFRTLTVHRNELSVARSSYPFLADRKSQY